MKNIINATFFLFAVTIFGCNYSSNKKPETQAYTKDGLTFVIPEYWKVDEDRPVKNTPNSRFISISDEEPFSKDAYIVMTAIDSGITLNKMLDNLVNQSRVSYAKRKIEFGLSNKPQEIIIGQQKALRVDYELRIIANRNKGTFTVFNYKDKIYSFVSVVDVKDKIENFSVVDSVIKSLHVK